MLRVGIRVLGWLHVDRRGNLGDKLRIFNSGDIDDKVDAIKDRPREFVAVGLDLIRGAGAGVQWVTEMTAGAWIHSGDKDEIGWVGKMAVSAGNGNSSILEWATEGFKDGAGKFKEFV